MDKNAKTILICVFIVILLILLPMCSDDVGQGIANIISGEDGKCDYCGKKAGIEQGTKEYCGPCFAKYDGNLWD